MKTYILFCSLIFIGLASCNWAKDKAKDTVNKTGEIVAKTGSEFVNGVRKGVEKTFSNEVRLSDVLKSKGIQTGKILVSNSDSAMDNVLTMYIIFGNDFSQMVVAKVYDEQGLEYGRAKQMVEGKKGDAKYFDFIFDKRTNIDSKGSIRFE